MKISLKTWMKFKDRLSRIDNKAAYEMERYVNKIGGYENHVDEVIKYAYALTTRYGEAAAAAACEMYDAIANASDVSVPPAEPAPAPEYGEVAKAVNGTAKNTSAKQIPKTIGRLVKRTGADTTLKNAQRDGAQFAWIPTGDTCAFCLTLASRGWQYMSEKALKNGHAEHIHPNCDCTYAVRFNSRTNVEGYDPQEYKDMYYNAPLKEGQRATAKNRINALRREFYAKNKGIVGTKSDKAEEFMVSIDDAFNDKQKEKIRILNKLVQEYNSPLKEVEKGGTTSAGEKGFVGIGTRNKMNLSNVDPSTVIHEFAHTLAMKKEDKLNLSNNKEFWKEIQKIKNEHSKAYFKDNRVSISGYANKNVEEFMAESFALAKMKELGIEITDSSGLNEGGLPYAQKVLEVINKYFKRK